MKIVLLIILGLLIVAVGGWIAYDQITGVNSAKDEARKSTEQAAGVPE